MIVVEKPHELVREAARGRLPEWAVAGPERRAHMARVADLMDEWAAGLDLGEPERVRWRAVGHLHDALRDEHPDALRPYVPERFRALSGKVLHGPAAAERLRTAGVTDLELLEAITFHTNGEGRLGLLGRALYAADFLEPGRTFLQDWRAECRARMPAELHSVLLDIVRARIDNLPSRAATVLPETIGFWNALASETK
jgi:2-amino-4-hydroxy-6-hydroxymethyldihydropteridine diphosphokinase